MGTHRHYRSRWLVMSILCLGALMIVLDVTIVNVALPSIRADLHFDDASLACGLTASRTFLVWTRGVQGLGGAVVDSVSLSLIMNLFTEMSERTKAMGFMASSVPAAGA